MEKIMHVFVTKAGKYDRGSYSNTADLAWQHMEQKTGSSKSWLQGQGHKVVRCYLDMIKY